MDDRSPDSPASPSRTDGAGAGRRPRLIALAMLVACAGGIGYLLLHDTPARVDPDGVADAGAERRGGQRATTMATGTDPGDQAALRVQPTQQRPAADELGSVIGSGQPAPRMAEVIEGLHRAGIRTGLGAFNPPGTSPPLVGLAVPDDYVLPDGYVRHHQATDDGQAIEPILMYSPDYTFVDAAGQPVPIPADRVVPATQAPPGLPVRLVRIPAPRSDAGAAP